jgi:L-iditol 2-dehydrogenase
VRAVVLDAAGRPRVADVPEPEGEGPVLQVRACGLCGSDLEKLGPGRAGTVLGHEVAAEDPDGRLVALAHHLPCGDCERCRAGHESTCEEFAAATIVPGGFAERVRAADTVALPADVDAVLASYTEPVACVLRALERTPRGRVLVVGCGFVGRLFLELLRRRGDEVFGYDPDPARAAAPEPDGPVDASVLCAPAGGQHGLDALAPGGTLITFASAGPIDLDAVYRRELQVVGSRSATPRHMDEAARLLPELSVPEATVLPLERFDEGLDLYRRRAALKVVFTP